MFEHTDPENLVHMMLTDGRVPWTETEVQTVTLSEFLLARIAEDEKIARQLCPGRSAANGHWPLHSMLLSGVAAMDTLAARHIARHDPARVLAECEAKRRIVHEYEAEVSRGPAGSRDDFMARHGGILDACRAALRILALPYADHPSFRQEWRP